jgi:HD-like signal output (HDOD) protein
MISNHLPEAADSAVALQKLRGLPPLSATTTRILSQTLDSDSSMADLEHIFRSDPSLTTNLLMTANSAAFSGRSRISTILHALSILGLDRVRSLAMAVTMSRYIKATIPPRTKAVEHVWTHAVATAVIAEQLGKFSNLTSSSVLYTAGLMHDMGRLGLLASIREPYQHFLGTEFLNIKESEEQEIQIFGISHTAAGEYLLHTWELPQALSDCCRHHHDDAEPDGEEVRIIRTACIIADALGYPELVVKERVRSVSAEIWVEAHATDSLRDDVEAMIGALLV